jgi:hypothetical protein
MLKEDVFFDSSSFGCQHDVPFHFFLGCTNLDLMTPGVFQNNGVAFIIKVWTGSTRFPDVVRSVPGIIRWR